MDELTPYESQASDIQAFVVKKKKSKKIIAGIFVLILCIVVSAVSGAVSSFVTVNVMTSKNNAVYYDETTEGETFLIPESTTVFIPTAAEDLTSDDAVVEKNEADIEQNVDETVTARATKTKGEIYSEAVDSIVGIKAVTTITSYSFFGQAYTQEQTATGSGFFVSNDGYIVTNHHVVDGAEKIFISTYNGDEYSASLVGSESSNDVAVLKIDAVVPAVKMGDSSALRVGDDIMVIGNPLGSLSYTFTDGIVSFLSRSVSTSEGTSINMFQTNAAINSGNSGGPVYNMDGEVIGIASAKYSSETVEGLGFCIPIDDVKLIINDIITYGYVTGKPFLGVSLQTITSSMSIRYSLPVGCYIVELENGGPADLCGIKKGDVITAVNSTKITSCDELSASLVNFSSGDRITLTFSRNGTTQDATVTLGEAKPADARTNYSNVYDY